MKEFIEDFVILSLLWVRVSVCLMINQIKNIKIFKIIETIFVFSFIHFSADAKELNFKKRNK